MRAASIKSWGPVWLTIGLLVGPLGCGSGGDDAEQAASNKSPANALPAAAVPNPKDADAKLPTPEKNTPEWYVREITMLRLQPMPETDDMDAIRNFQRERNYKIVDLAKQAIQKTHADPKKERIFEVAVHHAMEAQLQLAIQVQGVDLDEHNRNVDELYENVALLQKYDPASKATNEGCFTLVRFAEIMAGKFADEDPQFLEEYAKVARLFARNFPSDEGRAIAKLDAAGWSCEAHGLTETAIACYSQIAEQFPKNPRAQHIAALLRRLKLKGQELELAGPTEDGKFLSIDSLRNKVVLVAFWAADTEGFDQQAELLKQLHAKYAGEGFEIVGVNLDEDEARLQSFIKQHGFTWPNIFYLDPAKRRWNNPLVRYYGVREIPTYWLVDKQGIVAETQVNPAEADAKIQELLAK